MSELKVKQYDPLAYLAKLKVELEHMGYCQRSLELQVCIDSLRRLQPEGSRKARIECSKCHEEWSYGHVCKPAEAEPERVEGLDICICGTRMNRERDSEAWHYKCPKCGSMAEDILPAEAESSSAGPSDPRCHADIEEITLAIAELPDRTSPDDWPEAMLVTSEELKDILEPFFPASQQVPRQELKADNLFGVYCDGNPMGLPNAPQPIFWDGWQRLADWLNKGAASQQVDVRELVSAATELLDAMETCHICKGALLLEETPIHCEDCSSDCENHEGEECVTIQALHQRLRAEAMGAATPKPEDDLSRCAVCGWPLADSWQKGCVRGNCSMRPIPARFYNSERANKEYTGTLSERGAATAQPTHGQIETGPTLKEYRAIGERGSTPGEPAQVKEKP